MKKILLSGFIFLIFIAFSPINVFGDDAAEPRIMVEMTRGKLNEFVRYVLKSGSFDMRKFFKKKSLKKQLKKNKFPVEMDMPTDEQIEHMAGFVRSILGYREYASLANIRLWKGSIKLKSSSEVDEIAEHALKYKLKPREFEAGGFLKSTAKKVHLIENPMNSAYLVYYDTCMVHKAGAALSLARLMQSNDEYSETEIAQMMAYGRKCLEDDYIYLQPSWLIKIQDVNIMQMKAALELVVKKKVQINLLLQLRGVDREENK